MTILTLADVDASEVSRMLSRFGLRLVLVNDGATIPGSYWGEPEAGLVADEVHARRDTPVHSVLHESSHYVCMTSRRRADLERDAGGDDLEESAVCYLQVLLTERLEGVGRERAFRDMDAWGYSFRLGSTASWFERDAADALGWLRGHGILDDEAEPTWALRES